MNQEDGSGSVRLNERLGVEELKTLWNANADIYNSWDSLGLDEIVEFAQRQELRRIADWVEQLRNDLPAMGIEIANAIRYLDA